ncbi:MAG: hypothetical protein CVV42_19420 [Candidatus Riflebacteria bacterium HGW-Riflebacteria-2]|jgi:uncharacterized membrane protein|nr:MAG: hypothetical protein CVV42_19420 [Candidatus Riflebacteria bacterium HGW-Riflebacteria-2]
MIRKIATYILVGLICLFPAFLLAVALLYAVDLAIGGGLLYTSGVIDQIAVLVTWFLLTNHVFRWYMARQRPEKDLPDKGE